VADILGKKKRPAVMAAIRSRGNRDTELRLIAIFRDNGITGWRRNRRLFGKPDFVFPTRKLAAFVDGCFWHGCPLHATQPKTNAAFWRKKLAANRTRDRPSTPSPSARRAHPACNPPEPTHGPPLGCSLIGSHLIGSVSHFPHFGGVLDSTFGWRAPLPVESGGLS